MTNLMSVLSVVLLHLGIAMSWSDTILQRLDELEEKQTKVAFFETMAYSDKQLANAAKRIEQLSVNDTVRALDDALNRVQYLEKTVNEQNQVLDVKETVNNELMVAFGAAKRDKESMKELYKKLEEKHRVLQQEMEMAKKMVGLANDHVLQLQMENNMLELALKK